MEAPRAGGDGEGRGDFGKADGLILADLDSRRKAYEDLRAKLALAGGFALVELSDGSYLVTKWNCCRPCVGLAEVRAFLRQVSGGGQ